LFPLVAENHLSAVATAEDWQFRGCRFAGSKHTRCYKCTSLSLSRQATSKQTAKNDAVVNTMQNFKSLDHMPFVWLTV